MNRATHLLDNKESPYVFPEICFPLLRGQAAHAAKKITRRPPAISSVSSQKTERRWKERPLIHSEQKAAAAAATPKEEIPSAAIFIMQAAKHIRSVEEPSTFNDPLLQANYFYLNKIKKLATCLSLNWQMQAKATLSGIEAYEAKASPEIEALLLLYRKTLFHINPEETTNVHRDLKAASLEERATFIQSVSTDIEKLDAIRRVPLAIHALTMRARLKTGCDQRDLAILNIAGKILNKAGYILYHDALSRKLIALPK